MKKTKERKIWKTVQIGREKERKEVKIKNKKKTERKKTKVRKERKKERKEKNDRKK